MGGEVARQSRMTSRYVVLLHRSARTTGGLSRQIQRERLRRQRKGVRRKAIAEACGDNPDYLMKQRIRNQSCDRSRQANERHLGDPNCRPPEILDRPSGQSITGTRY